MAGKLGRQFICIAHQQQLKVNYMTETNKKTLQCSSEVKEAVSLWYFSSKQVEYFSLNLKAHTVSAVLIISHFTSGSCEPNNSLLGPTLILNP